MFVYFCQNNRYSPGTNPEFYLKGGQINTTDITFICDFKYHGFYRQTTLKFRKEVLNHHELLNTCLSITFYLRIKKKQSIMLIKRYFILQNVQHRQKC